MSSTLLDKRRLKDRNRNFNPRWEEEFAFINFAGRPLCLICNVALTHFKSCNLKRHYETHHKSFAIEYPPWSERRRKRLLALKISRTHQDIPLSSFDEETRLATEAGFVISQACAQNSRLLSDGEACKQLVLDVVTILDPLNGRLRQLITDIPLVCSSWLKTDATDLGSDLVCDEPATTPDLQAASDESMPNSPRQGPTTDDPVRRSLVQHIQDIENASGCFVCSVCPNTTVSNETDRKTPFSCADPEDFHSHLSTQHPRVTNLVCVYCNLSVQSSQFVSHVIMHFFPSAASTVTELFTCPAEPKCPLHFASACYAPLEAHWNTYHAAMESVQSQFHCPHCSSRAFTSLTSWAEHIQRCARPLVHCSVPGCLVKSPSRCLLIDHYTRKHVDATELPFPNSSALIRETFEMLCSKPEILPSEPDTKSLDDSESKPIQPTTSSHANGTNQVEPRFVFLLRCPHCTLNTVRWQHFLLHASICPGATKAGLTSYRCRIYWCSDCQAVSTEQNLVIEHVTYTHKSKAFVVREQIRVAMLDSRSQPIIPSKTATGNAALNSTASATAQVTQTLSVSSHAFSFPSQVSTSSLAAQTSVLSGGVSDDTLGESIMNLAALARPSRQQSLAITNQTQPTTALPQTLPAIPLAPSSITAISLMPSAQVNVSTGSPVSLFPNAVALKTLQELTASGSTNVNSLSASEAASAVAAMAAAALTGLTGFDVASSTISSVASQAFPVTLTSISSSLGLNPSKILSAVSTVGSAAQQAIATSSDNCVDPVQSNDSSVSSTTTTFTSSGSLSTTTEVTVIPSSTTTAVTPTVSTTLASNNDTTTTVNTPNATVASKSVDDSQDDTVEALSDEKLDAEDDCSYPDFTGRVGDDMVSFPFDEEKFRAELSTHIRSPILDRLVSKMRQFSSYLVRILGKENHRRIPVCPECGKVFPYGLGDFKRHLLTVHLEVPREYLKECLRFTYLPKSEEKFQEVQEQLAMRQMRPRMLEPGRRRVPLPYSIAILRRLTGQLPIATREFLEQKMQLYSRLSVIVDTRGGFRRYKCHHCSYSSPHALADVRKHILGSHCGISTKHFRHCLQASRLDPVEFTLFSDDKLARLAKEFLNRRQGSYAGKSQSRSPSPAESAEPNGSTNEVSSSISSVSTSSVTETRSHDTYVSRFTAVVPGSKNPVTVRIRPPVPPDTTSVANDCSLTIGSTNSLGSPNAVSRSSPTMPQSPLESPESEEEFQPTTSVEHLDLATLPSIPGLEGADRVVDLPLPYSESVLRKLLDSAGATESQTRDIMTKMQIYSTYTMTRICRGDRTLAFRCPCGRLFVTTRQPDSGIRAATLADSRRHVMGVHARISHEFITICCQASRITRDYDFELYSDEMLLRLAMERPIKLSTPPSVIPINPAPVAGIAHTGTSAPGSASGQSGSHKSNSTQSAVKPLKELAPYPPILPNLSNAGLSRKSGISDSLSESSMPLDTRDSAHAASIGLHRESNEEPMEDRDASDTESTGPRRTQKGLEDPLSHLTKAQASTSEEVERIINLPYSSEALYSLVQGYCPASYFPILEEKMDVYSSLKVFITRRRGRRYFCCSGCSSSSPHGMGDIRKHILGVHAKVPERYKAAAMHCSRLSREDNTLLPNHVLLHLAKMKWKGTVIKPLAEMDLSQFGTRRASAVGLARPSGQFASQVYQPSMQPRDTKKLTNLPTSTPLSINKSQFTANTINKPMNPPPESDGSPLADELSSSCFHVDDSVAAGSDLSGSEEPYVIRINVDQCVLSTGSAKHETTAGCLYVCSSCQYASGYVGAVRAHVVRVHMSSIPAYQCPRCDVTYNTRKDATIHHQASHAELEFTMGIHLPAHRAAMSRVRIRDVDQEPAIVAANLKTLVREGKLGPTLRQQAATGAVDGVGARDSLEDASLFEDEVDDDDYDDDFAEDALNPVSVSSQEDVRPSKLPRYDVNDDLTSTCASHTLSNGEIKNLHSSENSLLHNGGTGTSSTTKSARATLSGSSRRKPSKLQLVQLKPPMSATSAAEHEIDAGNTSTTVISSNRWHSARSRSSSPEEPTSNNLMVDIGDAS